MINILLPYHDHKMIVVPLIIIILCLFFCPEENLYIDSNSFSGRLPDRLYNLESLTLFDGSSNSLSGTLSRDINKLASLTRIFLEDNIFRGAVPSEIVNLEAIEVITLHYNNFTGNCFYENV